MVWLAMPTAVELSQVTGVGGWVCPISSSAMRIGIASIRLSFSYGGYNRFDDAGVVFDGTVVVVNAEGAKPVMRAVTTACVGLNQVSGVGVKLYTMPDFLYRSVASGFVAK